MSFRRKTFSLIALPCLGFMAGLYGAVRMVILLNVAGSEQPIPRGGARGQYYLVGFMLFAGIVFVTVIRIVLDRTVFSRLSVLNRSVSQVTSSGDVSARVNCEGEDELSTL